MSAAALGSALCSALSRDRKSLLLGAAHDAVGPAGEQDDRDVECLAWLQAPVHLAIDVEGDVAVGAAGEREGPSGEQAAAGPEDLHDAGATGAAARAALDADLDMALAV